MTPTPHRDALILRHLAEGHTAIQIGQYLTPPLGLSSTNVMIADLAVSLGVRGHAGMVVEGYRRGILTPVEPQCARRLLDADELWLLGRVFDDWLTARMAAESGQSITKIGTRLRRLYVRFEAVNRANLIKRAADARVLRLPGGVS